MSETQAHYFNTNEMAWQKHEQFPVQIKTMESQATHPTAAFSMMRVRREVAG